MAATTRAMADLVSPAPESVTSRHSATSADVNDSPCNRTRTGAAISNLPRQFPGELVVPALLSELEPEFQGAAAVPRQAVSCPNVASSASLRSKASDKPRTSHDGRECHHSGSFYLSAP